METGFLKNTDFRMLPKSMIIINTLTLQERKGTSFPLGTICMGQYSLFQVLGSVNQVVNACIRS